MNNKIKLIISDMDGTLLNSSKELPLEIYQLIRECTSQNKIFAIATGRQVPNIEKYFTPVKDQMLIVGENGCHAKYQGENFHYSTMKKEHLRELIQMIRSIDGTQAVMCGRNMAYAEDINEEFLIQAKKYFTNLQLVNSLDDVEDDICKISIYDANAEHHSYPKFLEFTNRFQVILSAAIWIDVCNLNESKGNAINLFQSTYGIKIEETMAFGDYLNDLTLMSRAHYRYAMENAHAELKKICNYTTTSNDEEGVITVLKELLDQN